MSEHEMSDHETAADVQGRLDTAGWDVSSR
jgi:hypothetical protein